MKTATGTAEAKTRYAFRVEIDANNPDHASMVIFWNLSKFNPSIAALEAKPDSANASLERAFVSWNLKAIEKTESPSLETFTEVQP